MLKKLFSLLLICLLAMSFLCPLTANAAPDSLSLRYLAVSVGDKTFDLNPDAREQAVFLPEGTQSLSVTAAVTADGSVYWTENTDFAGKQTELQVRVGVRDSAGSIREYSIYAIRPLPVQVTASATQPGTQTGGEQVTEEPLEVSNPHGDQPFDPFYANAEQESLFAPQAAGQAGDPAALDAEGTSDDTTVAANGETGSILENATLRQPNKSQFNVLGIIVLVLLGVGLISVSFVLIYSVLKPNKSVFSYSSYSYSSPKHKSPMFPSRSNFYKFGRRYIR